MSAIRTGLVGAGVIATRHLPAWRQLGADIVVYSHAGAPALTERFGGAVVDTFDELLDRCDIVDVVTPTPAHREYAEAALKAGKDVICEKPVSRHHDDAVALAQLASQERRLFLPAHVVRYREEYATMRAAVRDGRIGEPAVARFTRTGTFPTWSPWFADPNQSGGVVLDLMLHDLDIARWVCGEVCEVYATASQGDRDGVPISTAHAVLTHTTGAISHVTGVWGPPAITFSYGFHVSGTQGVLSFDSATSDSVRVNTTGAHVGATSLMDAGSGENPFHSELQDFARAIGGGRPARVTARDGVVAVDLALAAMESIERGAVVPFRTWGEEL